MATDEELIALARQASLIKPVPEDEDKQKNKLNITSFDSFLKVSKLKPGKYVIDKDELYTVYRNWASNPMAEGRFMDELKTRFTEQGNGFKFNIKIITLEERMKVYDYLQQTEENEEP